MRGVSQVMIAPIFKELQTGRSDVGIGRLGAGKRQVPSLAIKRHDSVSTFYILLAQKSVTCLLSFYNYRQIQTNYPFGSNLA